MDALPRPLPTATPTSAPFWAGLREGVVRIQRCDDCERFVFYPRSHCPHCLSPELIWRSVSGRGTLHTFTVTMTPTAPMFADDVPQQLAIVELDEGVRLASTLVDVEPEAIEVGMRLEAVFDPTDGGEGVVLRFRPARDPAVQKPGPGKEDRAHE
jgi:uncharacterized OB-fold protein